MIKEENAVASTIYLNLPVEDPKRSQISSPAWAP